VEPKFRADHVHPRSAPGTRGAAKAVAAVLVTVPATAVAFAFGAVGNVIGTALADIPAVWDQSLVEVG
jgi:hypothetical protein